MLHKLNLDTKNDRLLTVAETAEFMNESELVVLDKIKSGLIPAFNIGRGLQRPRWRILASELGMYLVNTRQPVVEPTKPKRAPRKAVKDYFAEDK